MAAPAGGIGAPGMFKLTVRDNVPAIQAEERPACEAWLCSIGFLGPGRDEDEALEEMGLSLDEARNDDLLDLVKNLTPGSIFRGPDKLFNACLEFLLLRSAVSDNNKGNDFISCSAFTTNILPINTPIHQQTGQPAWQTEIQAYLNAVDNSWLDNNSSPRPSDHHNRQTCTSAAWTSMLTHLRSKAAAALGSKVGRPMYEVAELLARLQEARNLAGDAAVGGPPRAPAQPAGPFGDRLEDEADLYQLAVRAMLGGRTVAEFSRLRARERATLLRHHLVQPQPIWVEELDSDDALPDSQTAAGLLLRQLSWMGADDVGQRMVAEARAAYYGENVFRLPLGSLQSFLSDSLEDGVTKTSVPPLVQKGVVVDLRPSDYFRMVQQAADATAAPWIERELSLLLFFTQAGSITIREPPALVEEDEHTHRFQVITIAPVVKRLLAAFGERLNVVQDVFRPPSTRQLCLLPYWDRPTKEARRRVEQGTASLPDTIRVEIASLA
ncbi:hypothetical protein LX32DRAFT_656945 [Colletotrichum zoysiae]|uniref:Uncharacterized protein n=1 Tax=Colletotrichum zoysiae TaxID=1216348 RepID=A0AAD9H785_9PEZI|nr:hypothetical protein LX32DRAFT_656945 [Colletotrichum zoysiae]